MQPNKIIGYYKDGSIETEMWWVNGEELTKNEIIAKKRKIMIDKILCDI